jgi:aspartate racemase
LFQAPTIAEFARLLQQGGAEVRWTNLSPIQPDGDRAPFFCVHGDEANYFIPRHLGTDQPFYAFFHQGEDGSPIRYTTVHEIARHFIEEMRSVRPHGPYLLGGYSFGGIVAYEMAQQLHDAGEEVPLLALFDTYDPLEYAADMARGAKWYDPAKNLVYRWLGHRALRKHGRIENPKVRHHYIIDTYDKAITSYRPEPFTGAITVFKASATTGPDHMGWERLAKGGVDVVHITGDHYNLIKEPHVRLLTAELAKRIDRALSKRSVEAV